MRDGPTPQYMPRLIVPHSTHPSLSPPSTAHSFITGHAVINTHTYTGYVCMSVCVLCSQCFARGCRLSLVPDLGFLCFFFGILDSFRYL